MKKHLIATATIAASLIATTALAMPSTSNAPSWAPARRCEGLKGPARARCNNMTQVQKQVMKETTRDKFRATTKRFIELKEAQREAKERAKKDELIVICFKGETMKIGHYYWTQYESDGATKGACPKSSSTSSSSTSSSSSSVSS